MPRKKQSVRVYFDADWLVYSSGFSVEHTDYALVVDGTLTGTYEGKEALNVAREKLKGEDDLEIRVFSDTYLEDDALVRAKHNVKSQIDGVERAISKKYPKATQDWIFVLTGGMNFRDAIATIRPYKGNRQTRSRPLLYQDLRAYLREVWGAYVVHGYEADDEVAILQTEQPSVLVHVDKDLLQVPGVHYVPGKGWANLSEEYGLRFFYRQVISGDTADNIGGVYRAGEKRAKEVITKGMAETDMAAAAIKEYEASLEKYGAEKCGYDDAYKAFVENGELLWLIRRREALPTLQRPARAIELSTVAPAKEGVFIEANRQAAEQLQTLYKVCNDKAQSEEPMKELKRIVKGSEKPVYTEAELDDLTEELGL